MNWTDADAWNSAANGSGPTNYTNPQNGTTAGTTYKCNVNGKTVTLDADVTVDEIDSLTGVGGTLVIGASTTRNVSAALVVSFASGSLFTLAATRVLNWIGTVTTTGNQTVFNMTGGTLVVSGAMSSTGTGQSGGLIYLASGGPTVTVNGNITITGCTTAIPVYCSSGTLNHNGLPIAATSLAAIATTAGTHNWYGTFDISSGTSCSIRQTGGTINLYSGATPLILTVAGGLLINKCAGTLNFGSSSITQSASTGMIFVPGATIVGPTLPGAANVWTGSGAYGYAGGLLTPTKVASYHLGMDGGVNG
jgi:hypothetical protein